MVRDGGGCPILAITFLLVVRFTPNNLEFLGESVESKVSTQPLKSDMRGNKKQNSFFWA